MRLERLLFASSLFVAVPSWALGGERALVDPSGPLPEAASAGESAPPTARTVREVTLPSRLRVVLDPDASGAEVSVCTSVDAGSRRDPDDSPGAERLLAEILTLGGFPTAGSDRAEFLATRGIRSELLPARDLMTFCTTAPAVELPLALWVTAGRFAAVSVTAREQKAALERLAQAVEARDADVIDGRAPVRLRQMVLLGTPEYAHPELSDVHELETIELGRLRRLHEESYVALGSVVTVSGSFEPEVAERLLGEQLGRVRTGTLPEQERPTLVAQSTPRFSMAEDSRVKSPSAFYGWLLPEEAPRDDVELALWTLAGSARLGQKMVGPGKAARELRVNVEAGRGPGLLSLRVVGTGPQSLGTIEKLIEQEVRALATVAPSAEELEQVQERLRERRRAVLASASSRARALSEGLLRGQDIDVVLGAPGGDEVGSVDGEAVRLAALRYFVPSRQSTIEIYPKGWQDPWQVPMPVYHLVSAGETLTSIAKQHRTTVQAIIKMNGIREKTPIYPGDKLKVPRGKHHEEAKLRTHVVRRGDTLSALGLKYGVSARAIAEQNGMSVKQAISVGETLRIPNVDKTGSSGDGGSSGSKGSSKSGETSGSATPAKKNVYVVQSGETLGGIAIKHGVRLASLATANGLTTKSMVRVGQELVIPSDAAARRPDVPETTSYAVKNGDTLSGVAKKHGVTVTELEKLNGISRKATLRVGQTLKIPVKR